MTSRRHCKNLTRPQNWRRDALIWYNLAVVESRSGDAKTALFDVEKASNLGLPNSIQHDADELEAKLTYETRQAALSSKLGELFRSVQTQVSTRPAPASRDHIQAATTWQLNDFVLAAHLAYSDEQRFDMNNRFGDYGSKEDFTKDDYTVNLADLEANVEAGTKVSRMWAWPLADCSLYSVYVKAKDGKTILLTRTAGDVQRMRVQGQEQPRKPFERTPNGSRATT